MSNLTTSLCPCEQGYTTEVYPWWSLTFNTMLQSYLPTCCSSLSNWENWASGEAKLWNTLECIASSAWMLVVKMQFSDVVVAAFVRCWCKWWPRSFCEILLRMTKATLKVHRKCKESFTVVQEKSNFPQAFNLFWTLDSQCPLLLYKWLLQSAKGKGTSNPFSTTHRIRYQKI